MPGFLWGRNRKTRISSGDRKMNERRAPHGTNEKKTFVLVDTAAN
jgi:hypothetical protein